MFIYWSYEIMSNPPPPPIILIVESKMDIIFWALNPISFEDMSLWSLSLETYHSNIGVPTRKVIKQGLSTLGRLKDLSVLHIKALCI